MKPRKRNSTPNNNFIVFKLLTSPDEDSYYLSHNFGTTNLSVTVFDSRGVPIQTSMTLATNHVSVYYKSDTADNLTIYIRG